MADALGLPLPHHMPGPSLLLMWHSSPAVGLIESLSSPPTPTPSLVLAHLLQVPPTVATMDCMEV